MELDGQVVQLLATLNAAERGAARKVRAGDRLRIESVDEHAIAARSRISAHERAGRVGDPRSPSAPSATTRRRAIHLA